MVHSDAFETYVRRLLGGSAIANVNQASETSTYIYGVHGVAAAVSLFREYYGRIPLNTTPVGHTRGPFHKHSLHTILP